MQGFLVKVPSFIKNITNGKYDIYTSDDIIGASHLVLSVEIFSTNVYITLHLLETSGHACWIQGYVNNYRDRDPGIFETGCAYARVRTYVRARSIDHDRSCNFVN